MNKFNFDKILSAVPQIKKEIMQEMANQAKRYFVDSWRRKAFDGNKWDKRAKETKKTMGKAILVGRGTMRRAVNSSLKSVTAEKVVFRVEMPKGDIYPYVHNTGGKFTVKQHNRKSKNGNTYTVKSFTREVPQRQFIGYSRELNQKLLKTLENMSKKIWQ